MELPKIKKSGGGGMLDGIKSKLGFVGSNQSYDDGYDDRGYDERGSQDEFSDDYAEEYGEYGPDYREESYPDDTPGSKYDPYAPVTTRPARTHGRSSSYATHSAGAVPPKLVSIDDVRAHTQVPESLHRDPLPPRRTSSLSSSPAYRGDRTMVDATMSAPANTPNARAAAAQNRERSESLNSLFSSTTPDPAPPAAGSTAPLSAPRQSVADIVPAAARSYAAYASANPAPGSSARSITVLKPASYGEAERVAKALKAGDAVVIALRNTPDTLSKRILDFAFGVSCALDASVDCVADKVFVITRGGALSDAEKATLRNQGVL